MASPHVAGVSALLAQLHPFWSPEDVKAALMNTAVLGLSNFDGSGPVSATVMGSGRVDAFAAAKTRTLIEPPSVSFGLRGVTSATSFTDQVVVENRGALRRQYQVKGTVRYTDFSGPFARVQVAVGNGPFGNSRTFSLSPFGKAVVRVRLTLDPATVEAFEQLYGWFYFHPNIDGNIEVRELGHGGMTLHAPWHVSPLASADSDVAPSDLDLRTEPGTLVISDGGAGVASADLFELGTTSPIGSGREEDIAAVGARSFTGASIDGVAEGVPEGVDDFAGLAWQDFLTNTDYPAEPVEFGVATHGVRSTTDTVSTEVYVDLGADGVFTDPELQADVAVWKLEFNPGVVCVFKLPSTFETCDTSYFADYSNFNSNVTGVAVDASTLGLSDGSSTMAYQVWVCNWSDPDIFCDTAGEIDPETGTYDLVFDVTAPALSLSDITCQGFWSGAPCDVGAPVSVEVGSAAPGDDPSILALFPNNAPGDQYAVVPTRT
jgi:hypothetical protein